MPLKGERLRQMRVKRQYTQEELAERLNMGVLQINRYENEKTDPSADVVSRLAKELGVTADYLLGLADDPAGHLEEDELTPDERKLITALRAGLLPEALETLTTINKATAASKGKN